MAFKISPFLLGSLALLFFFCSLEKSFAFQTRREATEISNHDLEQHSHLVHLSSLFPSSTCSSSTKEETTNSGPKRKTSLKVVHKHGPCSHLKHEKAKAPTHSDILGLDQARVNYLRSSLSNIFDGQLDSATLPAKSGNLIGSGNYFVVVGLGTPKEDLPLLFDTGSDLTWTQCQPCTRQCYKQQDPIFDPSKSTSYSNITCTSSDCTQLISATGKAPGCSAASKACIYGIQYGDSSFSVGYFSREKLTITGTDVINNFLFGCGQNNQGLFGGAAGLLGLGRHPISFVQQTASKYGKHFSYCLPSTSSAVGHLTFGAATSNYIKYTPITSLSQGATFYGFNIVGIIVGGKKLPIPATTFSAAGALIDSGTVISRLPPTAYSALRSVFRQGMSKYPAASALSILDTCYDLSGYQTVSIPKISFVFGGGITVDLAAAGILYAGSKTQVCLAFAANGDDSDVTIFGNVQQKTLEVVYDVAGGRLGFGAAGCR